MKKAVLLLVTMICGMQAYAQDVRVDVRLLRPVPLQLSQWRTDPSIVQIQITALRNVEPFIVAFEVRNNNTGQSARTNNSHACMPLFPDRGSRRLNAGEVITINGPQLICNNAVDAAPELQRSVLAAGAIPEGDYSFCIKVINATDRRTEYALTGRDCDYFTAVWSDPPSLINPVSQMDIACTSAINLQWTPLSPPIPGVTTQYRVKVVGVQDGQEPRAALDAAAVTDVVINEIILASPYLIAPNNPRILDIINRRAPRYTRFAWQVQAVQNDVAHTPIATRGGGLGKSEIGLFWVNCASVETSCTTERFNLINFYPDNRDTVPWVYPHLIMQWSPFCNELQSYDYTLHINRVGGGALPDNSRLLSWGNNVMSAQGVSDALRASLIIGNTRNRTGGTPTLNNSLERGPGYSWYCETDIVKSGRTFHATSTPTEFSLGLKMPVNPEPANNAVLESGAAVALRWDIPSPSRLMFDPPDVGTRIRTESGMEFGAAMEFVRVKLSRANDMSSPIASRSQRFPETGNYVTGESAINAMFGRKALEGLNLTSGTYYWRVEYCNPMDTLQVYRQGPIWRFEIRSEDIPATTCLRITPAAPENRGTVSEGTGRVRFSVLVRPLININNVRGGRLRIWRMSSMSEEPGTVKGRPPVFDGSFSGHAEQDIRLAMESGSLSAYNLNFLNGERATQTWTATNNTTYMWQFTLQVDGASIRRDGTPCTLSQIESSDGIFTFRQGCTDPCIKPAPSNTTPSSRSFAVGDELIVGHFRARLTRVSGTGSSLSGEATVNIPVFRGGMQVEFNNIQVNSDNEVYGGELRGRVAPSAPVNSTVANALTGGLGLTRPQVDAMHGLASDATRLVSNLVEGSPVNLPIGFDRVIEGQRVVVGVMGMVFMPTSARMNVVLSFPMPALGPGERIGFGARNLCFYPGGLGSEFDIGLVDDLGYRPSDSSWSFHFLAPRSEDRGRGVAADSGTFARFGCNGFEFIRIKAEVEFPQTWMKHSPDDGHNVKAQFTTLIRASGDFIAEATMEQFSPAGTPDFVMRVDTVALDFSDLDNPRSIRFPEGYRGATDNHWRGFYMNRLTMKLPDQLRTFEEGRPPQVEVANTLIDRTGFSMKARVVNIIQYPRGNFGEWGASLDTAGIDFVSSSLERGYLMGRIKIPISDSALAYSATLARARSGSGLEFEFNIRPRDTINAPLWVARLRLNPTSYIRLNASARGFVAEAMLSGGISITGDANGIPLGFRGIRFENFHLTTNAPYIECGNWSFASPQHGLFVEPEPTPTGEGGGSNGGMSGFPVSIGNIQVVGGTREGGRPGMGIRFTISVNLQPGNNAISGGTTLSIWGAMETAGGMRAVFDGVDLDSIGIRADMGAVAIEGSVAFYRRDPTFGTGFRGRISANFLRMVQATATMQFGAKPISPSSAEEFRYWYVDARVTLSSGIMVFSGVGIYGFGGGAWYNMVRETPSSSGASLSAADRALLSGGAGASAPASSTPGQTNSGTRYVPSYDPRGATFGFYGMITVGTYPSADAFNCDVRLEVSFAGGGIREIRLRGDGYMMAGINSRSDAKVTMYADIYYNFPDRIFHGDFDVRIRAAVVTGGGHMVMHFAPTTWYVKIGDPEAERVNINLMDIIQVQAYVMCGMNLPNSMNVPREITELIAVPPPPRGMAQLTRGDGFAFGARADIPPGPRPMEMQFLIFYASMKLMVGFDVSLLNYGPNATCANTGGAMGINGWYALGQMYARVDASIGIGVDLWFVSGRFEILGMRLAAILRAGLPNPTWMQGAVGGDYNILGGLVHGHCEFQFSVGEECRPIVESGAASADWFNQISPQDGATDVSIFVQPSVAANLPLEKPFYLEEPDGNGRTVIKIYRLKVRSFTMVNADRGNAAVTTANQVNANDAHYVVQTPSAPLTQRTRHTSTFTAYAQEFTGSSVGFATQMASTATIRDAAARENARMDYLNRYYNTPTNWSDARFRTGDRRGQLIEKSISTTFTTEVLPDSIRPQEVYLSYPRNRQRWYLQGHCTNGFISLLNNRADLFPASTRVTRYEYFLRFVSLPGNQKVEIPFTYNPSQPPYYVGETRDLSSAALRSAWASRGGYISFEIPPLQNNTMYAVQVIRKGTPITAVVSSGMSSFSMSALGGAGGGGSTPGVSVSGIAGSALSSSLAGAQIRNMYASILGRYSSSLTIQQRQISGFELGRTVNDFEKLLFLMFFKTSRHNQLGAKVATLTRGTTTVTPAVWNLQTVKAGYTAPELFDPFDIETQTVDLGTNGVTHTYKIDPLIKISGTPRTSRWHTQYANPLIYDAYNWMRFGLGQYALLTRQLEFDRAIARGENFVDAPSVDPAITDGEISSVSNPGLMRSFSMLQRIRFTIQPNQSGSSLGIGSGGTVSFAPYQWNVHYMQPAFVGFLDFPIVRSAAARLYASFCGGGDVGFTPAECARLRQIATTPYNYPESIRPSRYQVNLWYNYCDIPDVTTPMYPIYLEY